MNELLIVTKKQLKEILDNRKEVSDYMEFTIQIDKPYDVYWYIATEDDE